MKKHPIIKNHQVIKKEAKEKVVAPISEKHTT